MDLFKKKGTNIQKVKRIKVTAKDIQEKCCRSKAARYKTPINTPEYDALAKELDYQMGILKKVKDANQVISLKDGLVIGGTTLSLVFFIALAREYPTALKVASMILKFIPFKGI